MEGAWGRFVEFFLELYETVNIRDQTVRGAFIPKEGSYLARKQFGIGTAIELASQELFAVSGVNRQKCRIGDVVIKKDGTECRLIAKIPYVSVGSFDLYTVARIQGSRSG